MSCMNPRQHCNQAAKQSVSALSYLSPIVDASARHVPSLLALPMTMEAIGKFTAHDWN
jgi:hypothetical protein